MPGKIEITQVALSYVEATQNDKINVTSYVTNSTGITQSLYMTVIMGPFDGTNVQMEDGYISSESHNFGVGSGTFTLSNIPLVNLSLGTKAIQVIISSTREYSSGIVVTLISPGVLNILGGGAIEITDIGVEKT